MVVASAQALRQETGNSRCGERRKPCVSSRHGGPSPESRFANAHYRDAGEHYAIGDNRTKCVRVNPMRPAGGLDRTPSWAPGQKDIIIRVSSDRCSGIFKLLTG